MLPEKEVRKLKFETTNFSIERKNIASEIYFYKIADEKSAVASGKLVVE